MIGWLKGKLRNKDKSVLLVEIAGIGYEVQISLLTYCRVPECGTEIELYTHFIVREDEQTLYGFSEIKERDLFRILLKVNGVGPKLALSILSNIDPNTLVMMVRENDSHRLMKTPGIGKKTAERLVIELSDRLKDWHYESGYGLARNNTSSAKNGASASADAGVARDAISALIALGYTPQESSKAVAEIKEQEANAGVEDIVRLALKRKVIRDRV